jgi:hypothetical protein
VTEIEHVVGVTQTMIAVVSIRCSFGYPKIMTEIASVKVLSVQKYIR